ncbi:MAG: hypothetical protein U1F35_14740 [Steroidobacteraceae bacterium]
MLLLRHIDRLALHLLLDASGWAVPGGAAGVIPAPTGASAAGLIGNRLYARASILHARTPLHSVTPHESALHLRNSPERRARRTDAQGDHAEECAVCCLQVLMSDALGTRRHLPGHGRLGLRLPPGSTAQWFNHDAEDARLWLLDRRLTDSAGRLTYQCRS